MIIKPIKANVITGFLGVGKTTLISQLLALKPDNEVWAVLVNEFGEVGIDASLLSSHPRSKDCSADDSLDSSTSKSADIVIKEVAGGCLCCASGLPTQVAINQLIKQVKPDRLLIEPTGLVHPAEIITVLSSAYYQQIIDLRASICLVDARKVSDARYRDNDIFIQQLQIADIVVANKADLSTEADLNSLKQFMQLHHSAPNHLLQTANHFDNSEQLKHILSLLNGKNSNGQQRALKPLVTSVLARSNMTLFDVNPADESTEDIQTLAEQGFIFKPNHVGEHYSYGWIFTPESIFDFESLMAWTDTLKLLDVIRLKGVMITADGVLGINYVDEQLQLTELDDALDSRVEIIANNQLDHVVLQQQLIQCRLV